MYCTVVIWREGWDLVHGVHILFACLMYVLYSGYQSPKLKTVQSTVMKTSFRTRVSRMGLDSFVEIDFCYEILSYLVSLYSPIFSNLLNQNLHKS